ncbi:GtrA family protein [Uliginosibacterium sp. sgz301328]|uniref:GtrA family protein n=1 Tax=Uliginosibacterium sp. sgz301328 TaxID=3243764 RepID=UPI00359DB07E
MSMSDTRVEAIGEPATPSKAFDVAELARYFVVSVAALLLDFVVFMSGLHFGAHYLFATTAGIFVGVLITYYGSIFWVFPARRLQHVPTGEFSVFIAVGLVGWLVSCGIMSLLVPTGILAPMFAKGVAAAGSFFCNYGLRKILLFKGK